MKKVKAVMSTPDRAPVAETELERDKLEYIAREAIFPDPDQPRKTFSKSSLDELALSIMEQGIVQPLIVQLVLAKYRIVEPDLTNEQWLIQERDPVNRLENGTAAWYRAGGFKTDKECKAWMDEHGGLAALTDRYMLVAGERRWRASAPRTILQEENQPDGGKPEKPIQWRGLDELPCIVRDLGEHRKFAQQWIENSQRENVNAIDEAEALTKQLAGRRSENPEYKAETLAAELGMSRAGLYQRLSLARLHKPIRDALLDGSINMSLAQVVAQLPDPKRQKDFLERITDEDDWEYPYSVRDAVKLLQEDFMRKLGDAAFDTKDATLNPDWTGDYRGACTDCPFRSGNMVALFPELKSRPRVCTLPACFDFKTSRHFTKLGSQVVTEAAFDKMKGSYAGGDEYFHRGSKSGTYEELMGKHSPLPVIVETEEGVKKYYPKAQATEAMKKNGIKMDAERNGRNETAAAKQKRLAEERESKENKALAEGLVTELLPVLAGRLDKVSDADAWKALWAIQDEVGGGNDNYETVLTENAKSPKANALALILSDYETVAVDYTGKFRECVAVAWKHLGVDLEAEFKKRKAASQKSLPIPAPKKEQAKLMDVKPNRKKKGKVAK